MMWKSGNDRRYGFGRVLAVAALWLLALGPLTAVPAQAGLVATDTALHLQSDEEVTRAVDALLARDGVRAALAARGVDPALAAERLQALTPEELLVLNEQMDSLPAGAGVVEAVGLVVIVLIVLEILGVTDVFTAL